MGYGALLADANGVPFYIENTSPLSLIEKRVIGIPGNGGGDFRTLLFNNDGAIRFVFVNSGSPQGDGTACQALLLNNDNNWYLRSNSPGQTVNVYIFGYQFQPVPAWGIQINDAQGRCILTNETKVLRDVQAIGNPADPNNSGFVLNTTLGGNWAIAPAMTGYFAGVINQGNQPRPVVASYYSDARFNGSTTQIRSGFIGNIESGVSNATYSNYRNRLTAINVSRY